jgi:hypothetical protein
MWTREQQEAPANYFRCGARKFGPAFFCALAHNFLWERARVLMRLAYDASGASQFRKKRRIRPSHIMHALRGLKLNGMCSIVWSWI